MGFEALVYYPFMEEETQNIKSWDKETIRYVIKNKSRVMKSIKSLAKSITKSNIQSVDAEDIYSEVLEYLYSCEDYSLCKAVDFGSNGTIISIDGYVHICIKNCVKRHITNAYRIEKPLVHGFNSAGDDRELDPFYNIEDESASRVFDDIVYNLESFCKQYECYRYKYGIDIFMLLYVRLLTYEQGKEIYHNILEILGINRREISVAEKISAYEDVFTTLSRCVAIIGVEKAIKIVSKYVYSADRIAEAATVIC